MKVPYKGCRFSDLSDLKVAFIITVLLVFVHVGIYFVRYL